MKRIVILILLVFVILHVQAQSELESSKIVFSNSSIQLDGELNEPIWGDLIPEGGFFNYIPNNGDLASNKTEVKMFHNGKNLFISAVYYDTVPDVQIGSLKRDDIGPSGADSDSFSIILDTYNQQQSGYFFIVNMAGALIDALVARRGDGFRINTSWNTLWDAKTSVKGNLKIFEIKIPLKALSYKADTLEWGVMFHTRNIKLNEWTTNTPIDRNYKQFDLRFTKVFQVGNLSENKSSRFTLTPSVTMNYSEDVANDIKDTMVKPSVDVQFNVSSSLKLDATINPDFSQIDVDRQVTNLSRFSVFFPERRNFFLENSDLFTNLGVDDVNPFYSRRIGSDSDISFGLKLSGNIAEKTRLYNYDAISESIIREGYTQARGRISLTKFYKDSKTIDNHRYLNLSNNTYWDDQGDVTQASVVLNNDLVFKDQSFLYGGMRYEYVNLKYAFDPLNNGNAIIADKYRYIDAGLGYSSADSKKFQYGGNLSYGSYYSGHKNQVSLNAQYRLMPLARLQIRYERNGIDLKELGSETFHLARFTGEIFFSNRLNWTTYIQYNTQFDNFNVNSRLQWEYKPLSYIYLVISDNYNQDIVRKNWGVAFKMNYRFDF
ncbi:MAG: hypothetical protein ACJA2M_000208 [Polaribacter sp.]|jgi:hypothetical protein